MPDLLGFGLGVFMYLTLFDVVNPLIKVQRWKTISCANRALMVGILIVGVFLALGGMAVMTSHRYVPLMVLGVFCGGVAAKVVGQFLAPKIQAHVTMFLGGITTGNLGSSGAGMRSLISLVGDQINKLVALIPGPPRELSRAVTLGIWIGLVTALVILGANVYYANQESSPVGNPLQPALKPAAVGGNG